MTLPNADELWSLFRAAEVSERELAAILMNHFKSAMPAAPDGVVYPANKRYALKLIYKSDALRRIEPGELLIEETVSKIREEIERLLTGPEKFRIRRWVLFSDYLPVRGHWGYRDKFLILPAPANSPQPPKHHPVERPFIVESQYRDAPDALIRLDRAMVRAKEIALLLNVLLETRVRLVDHAVDRYHWVLVNPDSPPVRVECLREWYAIRDFKIEGELGGMSATDNLPPLREARHDDYFNRWNLGKGNREMEVPDSLTTMLDRFFSASEPQRQRCLRFCFWFRHAHETRRYSATASYLALVHGIEALVPPAGQRIDCTECHKDKSPGPTRRFVDFVKKYATDSDDTAEDGSALYGMRSGISHGETVLWTDRQPGFDHVTTPGWSDQLDSMNEAWRVAQRVFVNYLLGLSHSP